MAGEGNASNVQERIDSLLAVDTEAPEGELGHALEGKPVHKVGFIVNDTISSATEQADRVEKLLRARGV